MPEGVDVGTRVRPLPRLELAIRLALAFAIAYQVIQRFTYTGYGMSEYGRSLWYVTYEHGFVRRGLAGEVLRTIVGGRPTIATVDLVQNVVAVVTLARDGRAGRRCSPDGAPSSPTPPPARWSWRRSRSTRSAGSAAPTCSPSSCSRWSDCGPGPVPSPPPGWRWSPARCSRCAPSPARWRRSSSRRGSCSWSIAATRARHGAAARIAMPDRCCAWGRRRWCWSRSTLHGRAEREQVFDARARRPEHHRGPRFGVRVPRRHVRFELPTGASNAPTRSSASWWGSRSWRCCVAVFRGSLPYVDVARALAAAPAGSSASRGWLATAALTTALFALGLRLVALDHRDRVRRAARARRHRRDRRPRASPVTRARPVAPCRCPSTSRVSGPRRSSPPRPRPTCSCSRRCRTS